MSLAGTLGRSGLILGRPLFLAPGLDCHAGQAGSTAHYPSTIVRREMLVAPPLAALGLGIVGLIILIIIIVIVLRFIL